MEFEAGAACIDKAPAWRAVRFTVAVQGLWHFLSFLCRTPWRLASCCRVVKFEPLKKFSYRWFPIQSITKHYTKHKTLLKSISLFPARYISCIFFHCFSHSFHIQSCGCFEWQCYEAPGGHNVIAGIFDGIKAWNEARRYMDFSVGVEHIWEHTVFP